MRITTLETTLVSVPLARPIKTVLHDMRSVGCVLVRLRTDEGITGESFVFTLNGARLRSLDEMVRGFAHQVEGKDPHFVSAIGAAMWTEMNPIGHAGFSIAALAAVDMACWDIIGKAASQPLHHVFGASRSTVDTYASSGLWLSQSIDDCVEEAGRFTDLGFRGIKLRLGSHHQDIDIERVRAVRAAIGDNVELLVDINQGLDVKRAIALARALEPFSLRWIEEPVDYQNLEGHTKVRQATSIPIASGETEYTHHGMARILEAGAVDVLMPDLQRVGGHSEFRRAAAIASAHHIPVSSHFFTKYSICLAAAEPNCISVEHIDWFSPLFNEPVELSDGKINVPERPGLGFTFNKEAIDRYRLG